MSDKLRCASMTHGGGRVTPCKNYPSHGDTRCRAHGGEPVHEYLTDAIDKLKRERDEARAEVEQLRRVVAALKSMLSVSDPCIHVQMAEAVEAIKRGDTITLEELEARYPAFAKPNETSGE